MNIFVRDLLLNTTALATDGNLSIIGVRCELTSLTPDGRFVAYVINTNTTTTVDAFVRDLNSGVTTRISTNVPTIISNGGYRCAGPVLSDDGRYATFYATPLGGGGTFALRHDLQTSTTLVISQAATNVSHGLQISSSGQRVLFEAMDGIYGRPALWDEQVGGIIAPTPVQRLRPPRQRNDEPRCHRDSVHRMFKRIFCRADQHVGERDHQRFAEQR